MFPSERAQFKVQITAVKQKMQQRVRQMSLYWEENLLLYTCQNLHENLSDLLQNTHVC